MKRLLLSTLFLFFAVAAFAQKGAVSGTVLDADTGESVAGAVLEVAPVKTPDQKQYFTSGYKGAVAIPSLSSNEKFCWLMLLNRPMTDTRLLPLKILALPPTTYLFLASVLVSAS